MAKREESILDELELTRESGDNSEYAQLIVFKLGHEEYGLHIDQIKEVVLTPQITGMPQTKSYVKGVANIRGNVISIIDLEQRFSLSTDHRKEVGRYTLVVASEEFKIGILVTEVPNTLSVKSTEIEESCGLVADGSLESEYIKGIVKRKGRLIILIDIYKVMNTK